LNVNHVFLYVCVIIFGRTALQRISSNIAPFERAILILSIISILVLPGIWTAYIEDLDKRKFE